MKVIWQYALEYAGQLGHVAYRHRKLECSFDSETDQEQFTLVWQKVIGNAPRFAPPDNSFPKPAPTMPAAINLPR